MSLDSSGPLPAWHAGIKNARFEYDPAQESIVTALQDLYQQLTLKPTFIQRLLGRHTTPHGIYLWGDVGRGKTMLMDLFYDSLPTETATRVHFHRFMQQVHQALKQHEQQQNPLRIIARQWAACKVLCFDEFHVNDIADAMLLGELLQCLFAEGVVLVTTSNTKPDDLYKDGLQQDRFKPAITAINKHCQSMHLNSPADYRLRILKKSPVYLWPVSPANEVAMQVLYAELNPGSERSQTSLEINSRTFLPRKRGVGVIWFDFSELCEKNRGTVDYIEIARSYNSVFISGVPAFSEDNLDALRRFINLVDEFYDRSVKLLINAEVPLQNLYPGHRLEFEFKRTISRLHEMQNQQYLAQAHRP